MKDKLTGLKSGTLFYPDMETLISKEEEFALLEMDIDNFMLVNNDHGHEVGDAVLRFIAMQIGKIFPEPAFTYRTGGDHFSVLIPGCSKEEAFLNAEQLRKKIFEDEIILAPDDLNPKIPFAAQGAASITKSVCIGVASYPEDGGRPADISRKADSALMNAKKNGRNRVALAREEKLTPKTSHYTQNQLEKLSATSERLAVGESALLREALDDLLKKYDVITHSSQR